MNLLNRGVEMTDSEKLAQIEAKLQERAAGFERDLLDHLCAMFEPRHKLPEEWIDIRDRVSGEIHVVARNKIETMLREHAEQLELLEGVDDLVLHGDVTHVTPSLRRVHAYLEKRR